MKHRIPRKTKKFMKRYHNDFLDIFKRLGEQAGQSVDWQLQKQFSQPLHK